MSLYYYVFAIAGLSFMVVITRSFILNRKSIPSCLFAEALRNENSGQLEAALVTYGCALDEIKKMRFQGELKNKIVYKLKILHTVMDYENNFLPAGQHMTTIKEN